MGYRSSILIVIMVFVILFAFLYVTQSAPHKPRVVTVTIPLDASLPGGNFEPAKIEVIIGTNNTVRWENHDTIPSSVVADNNDDPGFVNATTDGSFGPNDQSELMPGESFEYTFTRAGEFGYHSVPHPQMRGTVIVLPGL